MVLLTLDAVTYTKLPLHVLLNMPIQYVIISIYYPAGTYDISARMYLIWQDIIVILCIIIECAMGATSA
jgi:uncharacterized membrane protein